MPIIRHNDIPAAVIMGANRPPLIMWKAIGWSKTDPKYTPEDWPYQLETVSVTKCKLWRRLRRIKCTGSDRVMYIIDGECLVQIGDDEPGHAGPGDYVLIPRGTEYEFETDVLTYLVINAPPFQLGTDLRNDAYDGPPVRDGEDRWVDTVPPGAGRRDRELG